MGITLRICLTGIFLFLQIYLSAQEKNEYYINTPIPDSLSKGADVVCRLDEQEVEIISPSKIILRQRIIYTILNGNGDEYATYYAHYNKLRTINSIGGTLYNVSGKEINHARKKDMSDFERNGEAFVSDDRVKAFRLNYNSYPYTVAFEEEDEVAGAMYIPSWRPSRSGKISLEWSRYKITAPVNYKFRYKMVNTVIKPLVNTVKDKVTYIWELRNLPVIPDEPFAVYSGSYDPFMLVGPTDFELDGHSGNMSEWKSYGKFYYSLQKDRDILPEDVKAQVHALVDNVSNPSKKIALLYDYLQKNTHYVLIQFGIGGLQTYEASYVAKNKYGDCKALSNFMIALLKEAGIKGNPVIIYGDEDEPEFFPDFPSHQFNHVICAIPQGTDTVWLECTDQYLPAGYLGVFTANRYGLFIDEQGGTLVHTPAYTIKDNISIRKIYSVLDTDGNLQVKSETSYKALSHDPIEYVSHHLSKDKQMEYLKQNFNLPTYTVNTFSYKENYTARIPIIQETLNISVTNYAHLTGKRIFFNPDILRRSKIKFPTENDRKLDFQFQKEFSEIDSVTIAIPPGYLPEAQPKDISLQTRFGRFQTHTVIQDDKITYYRQFDQYRGRFPASVYNEVSTFYNSMYEADHAQIVLVRKSN